MDTTNPRIYNTKNIKNGTTSGLINHIQKDELRKFFNVIIQDELEFSERMLPDNSGLSLDDDRDEISEEDKKDFYKKTFGQGTV